MYLNEIWLCELPPPIGSHINTQTLVGHVELNDRERFVAELTQTRGDSCADPAEWWLVMSNLWQTTTKLLFDTDRPTELTVSLLRQAHQWIAERVLSEEEGGTYRTIPVNAAGSSVNYYAPTIIPQAVDSLFTFVEEQEQHIRALADSTHRLMLAMCLGGLFFSQLLLIHPFRDGNGRLARILLSFFLQPYTVVPVSLYARGDQAL
jgi:Fic family protein